MFHKNIYIFLIYVFLLSCYCYLEELIYLSYFLDPLNPLDSFLLHQRRNGRSAAFSNNL